MIRLLALTIAALAVSWSAIAQSPPPGVEPLYAGQHGTWQVACSRVVSDKQVFCNMAQAQPYEGKGQATLIVGVQIRKDGEYVFFFLPSGFQKDSNVSFITDKKEAGELKAVDGRALRILPELSKTHIKQFMAGNTLIVQFIPSDGDEKRVVRVNLAGFTAAINDARSQVKKASAR